MKFRYFWLYTFLGIALAYLGVAMFAQFEALKVPTRVAPLYIATAVALQALFWAFLAGLWRATLKAVSGPPALAFRTAFFQQVLLTLGKYVPGKVWGMVARGAALKEVSIEPRQAAAATVLEQILLLHSAALSSLLLLGFLLPRVWSLQLALAALLLFWLGGRVQAYALTLADALMQRFSKSRANLDLQPLAMAPYYRLLLLNMGGWCLNGLFFAAIYYSFFSVPVSGTSVATLVLANTLGVAIGFLALFAPGGIGVREAISTAVLVTVMPLPDAVFLVATFRIWLVLTDALFGLLMPVISHGAFATKNN